MIHVGDATIHNNYVAPQNGRGIGKSLGAAMLGAALMATGGGSAIGLMNLLKPAAQPTSLAAPLEVEIPWQFKDGAMQFGVPRAPASDVTITK